MCSHSPAKHGNAKPLLILLTYCSLKNITKHTVTIQRAPWYKIFTNVMTLLEENKYQKVQVMKLNGTQLTQGNGKRNNYGKNKALTRWVFAIDTLGKFPKLEKVVWHLYKKFLFDLVLWAEW
jgi:hypothetical protein